jgi:riboflavin-specific deaminase-like protein
MDQNHRKQHGTMPVMSQPESRTALGSSDRPFVTVSYAQTLDGRLATMTGSSQWISGSESLRFAHELRASHDAIMVGVGTVCQDDPRLTVRLVSGQDPLRVVADCSLRTPLTATVLSAEAASGTVFAVTDDAPADRRAAVRARGATIVELPRNDDDHVDLNALLTELRGHGVSSLLVEGGATLITALLSARLVNRLAICIAPKVLGAGIEAVGDLGIRDLDRALTLGDTRVTPYGADLVIEGRVSYPQNTDDERTGDH